MKRLFLLTALILCLASCSREPAPPKPASRPYDAGLRDGLVIFWRAASWSSQSSSTIGAAGVRQDRGSGRNIP